MSFGPAISGNIDGKDYLFAGVNDINPGKNPQVGILVLDPQQPENLQQAAFVQAPDATMNIRSLSLSGTVLYVSASNSLWIIDVSNASAPKEISRVSDINAFSVAVSGKYAYIDDNGTRITIADISIPSSPQVVGHFELPLQDPIQVLRVSGSLLFALEYTPNVGIMPNANGLFIIDISSPLSLKQISYFPDTASPSTGYVPVGPGQPGQNFLVKSIYSDIVVSNNYAYLAASGPDGMQVLDISNPSNPKMIAHVPKSGSNRIILSGNYAYLIGGGASYIIDLSNPILPQQVAFWLPLPGDYLADFAVASNHIYFFMGGSRRTIEIFNVAS